MQATKPTLPSLRAAVEAAVEEFDMAVMFHEAWKPAAYDEDLHKRMGVSYATNAFRIVQIALRREMLLALARLWDKNPRTVGLQFITKALANKSIVEALAADRADNSASSGTGKAWLRDQMRGSLAHLAIEAIALTNKYSKGGTYYEVRERLTHLRNEHLAHRQIQPSTPTETTEEEIEIFYQDSSKLISLLSSIFNGIAYDPFDTAGVYRHYAKLFWATARGERTEGHPNYLAPNL
jgi:hypothetical protein